MRKKIIYILIMLKNITKIKKKTILISYSRTIIRFLNSLYNEGLILSYKIININNLNKIKIYFRYFFDYSNIENLKIISTPSTSIFLSYRDLCRIKEGRNIFFLSTQKGVMTSLKAKQNGIGGKLLFRC